MIGSAFNRMAQAVEDKVRAERQARDAEARLEERREMASLADQRVEEERRLIAHELHDEFGQSVTAIRSLALAIAAQGGDTRSEQRRGGATDLGRGGAPLRCHAQPDSATRAAVARHARAFGDARESGARLAAAQHRRSTIDLKQELPAGSRPERDARRLSSGPGRIDQCAAPRAARPGRNRGRRQRGAHPSDASRTMASACPADWARPGHFGLRGLADRVAQLGGSFECRQREPHGGARASRGRDPACG